MMSTFCPTVGENLRRFDSYSPGEQVRLSSLILAEFYSRARFAFLPSTNFYQSLAYS